MGTSEELPNRTRRGSGAGMDVNGNQEQHERSPRMRACDPQRKLGDEQVRSAGKSERPIVATTSGNAERAKGPCDNQAG